jgi:hypothetical protein
MNEDGITADRLTIVKACDLILASRKDVQPVLATAEGEQSRDPMAATESSSSTSSVAANSASSKKGSTPEGDAWVEDDFLNDGLDRYGEELPHHAEPTAKHPAAPTPAKGAPDSVFVLAKRLRQLLDHPKFPEQIRGTAKADMQKRVGKPHYEQWLQESIEAAEQYLSAHLEAKELEALGIKQR